MFRHPDQICHVCRYPKGYGNGNHTRCEQILLDVLFPTTVVWAEVDNREVWDGEASED